MAEVPPPLPVDITELSKSKVSSEKEYTGKITETPAPPDEKYEETIFAKEPPSSEIFGDSIVNDNRELHELHRTTNDQTDSYKGNVLWVIFVGILIIILRVNTYLIFQIYFFFGGFLLRHDDSQSNAAIRHCASDRPAAGAGGSSTNAPPNIRGRRHVRTSLFDNECNEYGLATGPAAGFGPQFNLSGENQEIFSIKGTKSIKINRHRDTVNVFPSGCMGIPQDALPNIPEDDYIPQISHELARIDINSSPETSPTKIGSIYNTPPDTPRSIDSVGNEVPCLSPNKLSPEPSAIGGEEPLLCSPRSQNSVLNSSSAKYHRSRPLSAIQRNPLTGVGYEDQDFIRQSTMKKRDGNPVLGQGYDTKDLNNKSKKIPPGGYSRGLW